MARLNQPRTNLPPELTSFVGREREVCEIKQLLSTTRLLTLMGVGGCGKTRLALRAASEMAREGFFRHGVWWVDLAALADPALVPQAVMQALGLRELAARSPIDALADYLGGRQLLLLFDNCEHLHAACAGLVQTLLVKSPGLHVLATSREPLAIGPETTWLVPSLSLPESSRLDSPSQLMHFDAPALFVERATDVSSKFALTHQNTMAVLQVCRRLDGIPLALELAAGRVNVLAVQQIAERLDDVFALLTSGNKAALLPRHQTLRATIDWSYGFLSEKERAMFRRLSVFAGGFSLEAVEGICSGDGIEKQESLDLLSHLVDKSLVAVEVQERTEARYRLLETIRQYALEKLEQSGEETQMRRRHLGWFLALAERAEPQLRGPEQVLWLDRLETEHDNLRAALAWSRTDSGGDIGAHLRLASSLFWFWNLRGFLSEGRALLDEALAFTEHSQTEAYAKALYAAGRLAKLQGDHATEQRRFEQSVEVWRELLAQLQAKVNMESSPGRRETLPTDAGNETELSLRRIKWGLGLALSDLGAALSHHYEHSSVRSLMKESLALLRASDDHWGIGYALAQLANYSLPKGDYERAALLLEESLREFRQTGDKWGPAIALDRGGAAAAALADYSTARTRFEDALEIYRELGDKWSVAYSLNRLGEVARSQGDDTHALRLYEEAISIHRELGSAWGLSFSLHNLGYIAFHRGDYRHAIEFFQEALSLNRQRQDILGTASCLVGLAGVAAGNDPQRAARLLGRAQGLLDQIGYVLASADIIEFKHNVEAARAQLTEDAFAAAWAQGREMPLEEAVLDAMALSAQEMQKAPGAGSRLPVEPINEREREVLLLIAEGLSNHEISDRLTIALSTVKWHTGNLFGKLGVRSRTQATARAKELHLL